MMLWEKVEWNVLDSLLLDEHVCIVTGLFILTSENLQHLLHLVAFTHQWNVVPPQCYRRGH